MNAEFTTFERLPECLFRLRDRPRWVGWRWELNEKGQRTKPPRQASGAYAHNDKRETWATFDEIVAAHKKQKFDGVGIQLLDLKRFAALDLDRVRNPDTGAILPWAAELIACGSYAELTPSGRGYRVIGKVAPDHQPMHAKRKHPDGGEVEFYVNMVTGRYVTVSGDRVAEAPDKVIALDDTIARLWATVNKPKEKPKDGNGKPAADAGNGSSDGGFKIDLGNFEDLPEDIRTCISHGLSDDRSADFQRAVNSLRARGWEFLDALNLFEKHPTGPAAKYDGRLEDELKRSWDKATDSQKTQGEKPKEKPKATIDFLKGAIYLSTDVKPILDGQWLIRDWIPRRGLSVIWGASGAGKSHIAADMACHVAVGRQWHGNPVEQGMVVYLALEGHGSLDNRVSALAATFGSAPVLFLRAPFSLAEVSGHAAELTRVIAEEAARKDLTVRWIVVDTLARAMAGMDENSSRDMGAAVAALESMDEALDCAVTIVHHSGKDQSRGERGSGSLRAAAEASIEVSAEGSGAAKIITATAGKVRDGEDGTEFQFHLQQVELGIDKWGRPVTSCTVVPLDETEVAARESKRRNKVPAGVYKFLEALRQFASDNGQPNPGGTGWPEPGSRRVVAHDAFVEWAKGKSGAAREADKRTAARKAVTALVAAGRVQINEGFIWEIYPGKPASEYE